MKYGLVGPATPAGGEPGDGPPPDALRSAIGFLLDEAEVDRVLYLGADEIIDDVVHGWAEELVPGEHPPPVLGEEAQQGELLLGELHGATGDGDLVGGHVDDDLAEFDPLAAGELAPAPLDPAEPGVELRGHEGMEDEVVEAVPGLQSVDGGDGHRHQGRYLGEGRRRPHVLDALKNGEISLIINTPSGRGAHTDEGRIRREALGQNVPILTTISAAAAAVNGIAARREHGISVKSLQEHHES